MWKTKCLEARLKITVPWFKGRLYSGRVSCSESYHLTNINCIVQFSAFSVLKHKMCLKYFCKFTVRTSHRVTHRLISKNSFCIVYTSIFKTNFGLFLFSSCTFCQQLKGKVCHSWWWLTKGTWWKDWIQWLEESQKQRHLPSFLISRHFSSSTILEFEFYDEYILFLVSSWIEMKNAKQLLTMISSELWKRESCKRSSVHVLKTTSLSAIVLRSCDGEFQLELTLALLTEKFGWN